MRAFPGRAVQPTRSARRAPTSATIYVCAPRVLVGVRPSMRVGADIVVVDAPRLDLARACQMTNRARSAIVRMRPLSARERVLFVCRGGGMELAPCVAQHETLPVSQGRCRTSSRAAAAARESLEDAQALADSEVSTCRERSRVLSRRCSAGGKSAARDVSCMISDTAGSPGVSGARCFSAASFFSSAGAREALAR